LGVNEEKIINLIKNNPNITIFEMALLINVTERTIERNISKLKKQGILRRIGSDKDRHWKIVIS